MTFELASLESKLCDLYAEQVSRPVSFNLGATAAISVIPTQRINIGENDIIADFSLPYLSSCDCDCEDIPRPTEIQLGLPTIAMPSFFEYNLGDYAFSKEIFTSTYGCSSPQQLIIDVRPFIRYSPNNIQEPFIKLKFVVNGETSDANINIKEPVSTFINTAKGGTVRITNSGSNYQYFLYNPPANFQGLDTFEYVFEVYDITSNIKLRSGKAPVVISVTSRCSTGKNVAGSSSSFMIESSEK
jgi:hypothetical protein